MTISSEEFKRLYAKKMFGSSNDDKIILEHIGESGALTSLYLPGNVPSSKNNKEIYFKMGATNPNSGVKCFFKKNNYPCTPFITDSHRVKRYRVAIQEEMLKKRQKFLALIDKKSLPLQIEFMFIRDSHIRFDFHNACQVICDLMQEYKWIKDDNMDNLLPVPPLKRKSYIVNKEQAGVILTVLN